MGLRKRGFRKILPLWYTTPMQVVIPKDLQQQVRRGAQRHGVTETEYVRIALKQAIKAEESLAVEMDLWEQGSLRDFERFAKVRKL